jgi:uncharacterized protein YkwD
LKIVRSIALPLLAALLLASCASLQGIIDPFIGAGSVPPNTIAVSVSGLPIDIEPGIVMTGPGGFSGRIGHAATVSDLEPGEYVLDVSAVSYGLNRFAPTQDAVRIQLGTDRGTRAIVVYQPHPDLTRQAIAYLNAHREAMGIQPVSADLDALAHWLHARYATENNYAAHDEDPRLPFYTDVGRGAAQRSNLAFSSGIQNDPRWAIDSWLQAPFHNAHNLNPVASTVRFGIYRGEGDGFRTTAVLEPSGGGYRGPPVTWPGPGQTVDVLRHTGEWPSPLTSCPGYELPAGLPLLIFAGSADVPTVRGSTFMSEGVALEHCVFTGGTYENSHTYTRDVGRSVLNHHRAVVIVPKRPLRSGASYDVSVSLGDGEVAWSFRTGSP